MTSTDRSHGAPRRWYSHVAMLLHRYFLGILLAVYLLAGVLPGPGAWIRELAVHFPGGRQERFSMVLLAVILFCAAVVIEWTDVRELIEHPSTLLAGLLAGWFGPLVL